METENLKKFKSLVSNKVSNVHEKMEWREANQAWLKKSALIALKVLRTLKANKMTQKDLAELMKVQPQQISKIVKGQENLSLETICKLEKALGIQLIPLEDYKYSKSYYSSYELTYIGVVLKQINGFMQEMNKASFVLTSPTYLTSIDFDALFGKVIGLETPMLRIENSINKNSFSYSKNLN